MPSTRRCVFGCETTGVAIHNFPNPTKDPDRFKIWVILAGPLLRGLTDEEIYHRKKICDIHFRPQDKTRNNRISAIAVPSLLVSGEDVQEEEVSNPEHDDPPEQPSDNIVGSGLTAAKVVESEYNIICQLCLQSNVKMHELRNQDHKSFIENILELNGLVRDSTENYYACYICMSLLSKTYKFTQMVVNAHKHFHDLLQDKKQVTISELSNLDRQKIGVSYNNLSTASFKINIDAADVTHEDGEINNVVDNKVHENEQTIHIHKTGCDTLKSENSDNQTNDKKESDDDYIEEYLDDVWLSDQESSVTNKINRKRKKSSDENYASSSGEPKGHDFHTYDGEERLSKIPRNKVEYPKKVDQMSDELLLFEFFEQDSASHCTQKRKRLQLRGQLDPFNNFEDAQFIRRYRLSKELVVNLCAELSPMFKEPVKSTDLSLENKVLTALSFYATGSYQRPTGDIGGHSMAQQTVSSVLSQVTTALNSLQMRNKYIVFPRTLEERNSVRREFYEQFGIPGVLGCIGCTQIAIKRPNEHEERYFCRKHYHSLNVQLICDANMYITSVDASYGGASHDSFIWNQHPIKTYLEALDEPTWLLGDSGYALGPNMMTPILDAAPDTPERHYTDMHVRARNIVDRTIGLLKARFRCLLVHPVLHYKPEVAASIVNACVILHNICNRAQLPVPELTDAEVHQEAQMQQNYVDVGDGSQHTLQQGTSTRARLVHRLWAARDT